MLSFVLEEKLFYHEFSSSTNLRTLIFNAKNHDFDKLHITGGDILDKGIIRIIENSPNDAFKKTIIKYIPASSSIPHSFQIDAYIPQNTFEFLLNCNKISYVITLLLEFDMLDGNIQCSSIPDIINWNIEAQQFEIADSTTLRCEKL